MQDREFKFSPSKTYITIIGATLLLSVLVLFSLPIALVLKLGGMVTILIYGCYILWHYGLLRSKYSIIGLKYCHDGAWQISTNTQMVSAQLLGDSTVTGWVSILRFKVANQFLPSSCIVFRDSLGLDLYRQLLVTLKN